jgi:glutamate N-acetyltransferase / amino-acid N-acetyltransferase
MSVTAAQGFVASGVAAGIRRESPDVALVRSLPRSVGGAVWTTNRVQAAPVEVSRRNLAVAEPQAVVINAGIANAATGTAGIADAERTAAEVGAHLGLQPEEVIVLSTGVIGLPLPMERLLSGVAEAASALRPDGGEAAAAAILTTDRGPKLAQVAGPGFTVGGMAKGAGMIHPRLATMLAVVTTDYPLESGEPLELLRVAVDASFNRISVDGECSTNDAVVLLANGASGVERDADTDEQFLEALDGVCSSLSRQIVEDGEGATTLIEVIVRRAYTQDEALAVARRIATSPLVKTAAFGRDPNWGRVLAAAGSAPWNGGFARLETDKLTVAFDGAKVFERGAPTGVTPELGQPVVTIELDLGLGEGEAAYLASDLTYDYVRLNAEYTT